MTYLAGAIAYLIMAGFTYAYIAAPPAKLKDWGDDGINNWVVSRHHYAASEEAKAALWPLYWPAHFGYKAYMRIGTP